MPKHITHYNHQPPAQKQVRMHGKQEQSQWINRHRDYGLNGVKRKGRKWGRGKGTVVVSVNRF